MHKKTLRTSLKIDLDKPIIDFMIMDTVINILNLKVLSQTVTETKNGKHIRIEVEGNYSSLEVVLLQSLMGSDFKRECFNFIRVKKGTPKNWNVLFNKKLNLKTGKLLSKEF